MADGGQKKAQHVAQQNVKRSFLQVVDTGVDLNKIYANFLRIQIYFFVKCRLHEHDCAFYYFSINIKYLMCHLSLLWMIIK